MEEQSKRKGDAERWPKKMDGSRKSLKEETSKDEQMDGMRKKWMNKWGKQGVV